MASVSANTAKTLTLVINTTQMYDGDRLIHAQAPHVVEKGVTYLSLRSLANYLGLSIRYGSGNREYVLSGHNHEFRFVVDSNTYMYNGVRYSYEGHGKTMIIQPKTTPSLMAPIRPIFTHLGATFNPNMKENRVTVHFPPTDGGTTPEPKPVPKPEAIFTTDKSSYMIGESIQYQDRSKNGGSEIIRRTWTNNQDAFFEPGTQTITLEIQNKNGQVSRTSRTITITNEVLYTKQQYDLMRLPIGDKLAVDRAGVLEFKQVPYSIEEKDFTLVRANSPERITREGIHYRDDLSGDVRFMIHKVNNRLVPARLYLIATNKSRTNTASLTVNNVGVGGPSQYVSSAGKAASGRYLIDLQSSRARETIELPPRNTRVVAQELTTLIQPNYTISAYVDVHSDQEVEYRVIALDQDTSLESILPYLTGVDVPKDGIHTRGTFEKGERVLQVSELVGSDNQRMVLTDGTIDGFIEGVDGMTGQEARNPGNYGVRYQIKFDRVAPNTAILLNPRGGHYAGAFLVNNKVVYTTTKSILQSPHEAGILYRTGMNEEKVEITFIPAAGSNLPVNLLFVPLQ